MRKTAVAMLVVLNAISAWGDGCFFPDFDLVGAALREPHQKAALLHDNGVEDLVIQVSYSGAVGEFAWVVPTPARPTVDVVASGLFQELVEYTFTRAGIPWRISFGDSYRQAGMMMGGPMGVEVLSREKLGVYDVAVLRADNAEGLTDWLRENGYRMPAGTEPVLADYAERGWVFTAMRVHPSEENETTEARLQKGALTPLRLTFETPEAIYPLKISALNKGETMVSLFVFARDVLLNPTLDVDQLITDDLDRPRRRDTIIPITEPASPWYDADLRYFRPVQRGELPTTRSALPRLNHRAYVLTKQEEYLEPADMTEDLIFRSLEDWGPPVRKQCIDKLLRARNPLALRLPEVVFEHIAGELASGNPEKWYEDWRNAFRFVLQQASVYPEELLTAAAKKEDSEVRVGLAFALRDALAAPPWPKEQNAQFLTLFQQLHEQLLRSDGKAANVAIGNMAWLRTPETLELLLGLLREGLSSHATGAQQARRDQALFALTHYDSPRLVPVFAELITKHSEDFHAWDHRRTILALGRLGDSRARPALETALRSYRRSGDESTALLTEGVLAALSKGDGATTRPFLAKGMLRDEVNEAMGGPGEFAGKVGGPDQELTLYRWETMKAAFEEDALAWWR